MCWKGSDTVRGFRDLRVYQLAYKTSMRIFVLSKSFPVDEKYSLTDQIRRSSRSICANLAEGYRKRQYSQAFLLKLSDCDAEAAETQVWIDFARDCGYLDTPVHDELIASYEEIGRMLGTMAADPAKFAPQSH